MTPYISRGEIVEPPLDLGDLSERAKTLCKPVKCVLRIALSVDLTSSNA